MAEDVYLQENKDVHGFVNIIIIRSLFNSGKKHCSKYENQK